MRLIYEPRGSERVNIGNTLFLRISREGGEGMLLPEAALIQLGILHWTSVNTVVVHSLDPIFFSLYQFK